MKRLSASTRRQFVVGTAGTLAVTSLAGRWPQSACAVDSPIRETEHFWCRLAPPGPYVDSQRGHKAFGFGDGRILLSEDNAKTWAHSHDFPDAENITFSCILKNGHILFATREKLFLSTDNLQSYREIIVKTRDGADYVPHKPKDPQQPGWYFHSLDGIHTWDVDGQEILVWGNYCNVLGGPVPINIYYSTDSGQTVKLAYSFGRNPKFQEKGTPSDEFLGDPTNSVICRHVHAVVYNPGERAFYACTGDINRGHGDECHWLRGVYDWKHDSWNWKVIISVNSNSRYKSGGINFVDGYLYWAADANGPKDSNGKHDRGLFRCKPEEFTDPSKHELLFNPEYEIANMIIEDGFILAGHCAPASTYATGFAVSPDMGKTWKQYDLAEYGSRSPVRFHPKNSDGWFRVDLRKGWIERAEVLYIKPKP